MDRLFMDEYYEKMRADEIETFAAEYLDDYSEMKEAFSDTENKLIKALGLEVLFDHSRKLTKEEHELWLYFAEVERMMFIHFYQLMKGAYMLGAEDRERMLR